MEIIAKRTSSFARVVSSVRGDGGRGGCDG
jgi:hypothetical protein